jgi:hypothetical protein
VTAFRDLPAFILEPFDGRPASAWDAGAPGTWTAGQIVAHLEAAMRTSADGFERRAALAPAAPRPPAPAQRLAQLVLLGVGWFPSGRRSPDVALPPARPERSATEAALRESVARLLDLEARLLPARARDLALRHPVLGDLTLPQWLRFHVVHARHHVPQIRARLA